MFFLSIRSFAAFIAKNEEPSPFPFNILLSLIPVLDIIHSSLVSTIVSNILLERICSGTYPPTAVIVALSLVIEKNVKQK